MPILASNNGERKILKVLALDNGKGVTQAEALYDAFYDWGLLDKLKAVCCDTTNSNLGCKAGAAKILKYLSLIIYLLAQRLNLDSCNDERCQWIL